MKEVLFHFNMCNGFACNFPSWKTEKPVRLPNITNNTKVNYRLLASLSAWAYNMAYVTQKEYTFTFLSAFMPHTPFAHAFSIHSPSMLARLSYLNRKYLIFLKTRFKVAKLVNFLLSSYHCKVDSDQFWNTSWFSFHVSEDLFDDLQFIYFDKAYETQ